MKLQNKAQLARLAITFSIALMPVTAFAAETGGSNFPDRSMLQLGAFSVFDSNTTLSASSSTTSLGTNIDFERDLDGDTVITTPRIEYYYRFNNRHRLELAAFQLERKGTRSLTQSITFQDRTFTANTQIDSRIKNDIYKVAYAYSFYHVDQVELAFSAGFNVLDYEAELASTNGGATETASTTAPMPVFGFRMDYAVTPKLTTRIRTNTFYFDFQDKIRGSLVEFEAGIEYRALRNFALGASLSRLAIDVDVKDDKFKGSLADLYRGVQLYGAFFF
ncbi:MAG: hypothetical protein V7760_03910 [Marinobacter sp.]